MSDNLNRHGSVHDPAKSYVGDIVEKMSATPSDNLNKVGQIILKLHRELLPDEMFYPDDVSESRVLSEATQALTTLINNEKIAEVRRAKKKYDDPDVIFSRYIKNRLDELATLKKGEK